MVDIYYLHRLGCARSLTMGDPICLGCRMEYAASLRATRAAAKPHKLKSNGHAQRHTLVSERINLRRHHGT